MKYFLSELLRLKRQAGFLVCLLGSLLLVTGAHGAAPAGTIIKNQASASYKDSNGVQHFTTSNIVETLIQQVAALLLTQDQSRLAGAGNQVFLPHSVTNTGNGPDRFTINVQNNTGDDFDLNSLAVYADDNQDGQPDIYTAVTQSPLIAMQGSWNFVVAASVPAGTASGFDAQLSVSAVSQFNSGKSISNTDAVSVTAGGVLELTKSISSTSGASPDGPFTVSLNYRNTGGSNATDVSVMDALPVGMIYIPGSARWNQTGNEVLTDSDATDQQGPAPTIRYCAYDATCSGLPEASSDVDNDSVNQITGIISTVAAGESGQITFQFEVAGGLAAAPLSNTAELEFTDGAGLSARLLSNTVTFTVLHQTGVVVNGSVSNAADGVAEPDIIASMAQGTAVHFDNIVWNTGNGVDTFDISADSVASSFPAGTLYRILQSDGMTPLLDSNGNGLPDTGPLNSGAFYKVVVQVIPPSTAVGDNGGAGYQLTVVATSVLDGSIANNMLNRLSTISTATVDITNIAELGNIAALGVGVGPEASAVSAVTVVPGQETTIALYVNNDGLTALSFSLAVSTVADFAAIELPAGWTISFKRNGEAEVINNTGLIEPGQFVLVQATVSVPVNTLDGNTSLYFRALSDLTGAIDIKHDQVIVSAVEQLSLQPEQEGQMGAGGSLTYSHALSNNGNVAINNIQLTTNDSLSADGWTSIIYEDTDGDNVLGASDQAITNLADILPGATHRLFVKVFSAASAQVLSANRTLLIASWNSGADSVQVTDVTVVAELQLTIVKEQAPDLGCDGNLDGSYGVGAFAVEPGNNCVSYRLTATNEGTATAYNIEVADATPDFTEYFGTASCPLAGCSVSEPAAFGQGSIVATLPSLAAGSAVILEFTVRVE